MAGFVETPRFYPYLTGRQNLAVLAGLDGGDAASLVDEALESAGLAEARHKRVRGYSLGMRQRLGLAAAMLHDGGGGLMAPRRFRSAAAAASVLVGLGVTGCGTTGITPAALQTSISRTFANLYVLDQADQGNPVPSIRSIDSHASCQKGTADTLQAGPGNWVCLITYYIAGPAYPIVARYKVDVQTDGCYAADGDGPASVNGSPTITGPHYQQVINPLALIDGCFDIT